MSAIKPAYYNEIDPLAAAWLRELIKQNLIAPGDVDERSIEVVAADDLRPYTQCHFFAGIGVWSYALRRAGWDDARPVWTGSCPCQPFSDAGARSGFADDRHLWPAFHRLIAERRPPVVFGEQVASPLGLAWLDAVHADLEASDYAVGAADLGAASVGAPHVRQRLYWVADSGRPGDERWRGSREALCATGAAEGETRQWERSRPDDRGCVASSGMADAPPGGWPRSSGCSAGEDQRTAELRGAGRLGDAEGRGCGERRHSPLARSGGHADGADAARRPGPTHGFWGAADWLLCTDGKWRPVEPESFPLAHGAPARVGRLRGYGNAIVAEVATAFIEAYRDIAG